MTMIRSLTRKTVNPKNVDDYRAFDLFWDGGFDLDLTHTGLRLWGVQSTTMHGFEVMSSAPMTNVQFLEERFSSKGHDLSFDFLICNDRLKQFDTGSKIAHQLHVPMVIIDHCLPNNNISGTDIMIVQKSRQNAISVGCHELISKAWKCDFTIPYGIEIPDVTADSERTNDVLVHGPFHHLNTTLHKEVVYKVVEDTNAQLYGLNDKAPQPFTNWEQCSEAFSNSKIFINLTTMPSLPRGLLLAMAHGCAVITNNPELTKSIMTNRENCLVIQNIEEIEPKVKELLNNTKLRQKLGHNAQQTIAEHFPVENFKAEWRKLLKSLRKTLYLP